MKSLSKETIKRINDIFDTPIATALALALWTVPLHLMLDIKVVEEDYENIKQFIEWFGVPYGLLIALVLVNVWSQFDATDRAFDREADTVLTYYNTLRLVSNKKIKSEINALLASYVRHINDYYFDEYENKEHKQLGDIILNNIRESGGNAIKSKRDRDLGIELLKLINELIDERGDRLSYSKQRMPRPVLTLSIISSLLWIMPFFVLKYENVWLEIFFLAGVTVVVVSILLIILDLDNPIGGTWGINLESWKDLLNSIK